MDVKQILQNFYKKLRNLWNKGEIQRSFRISYDVIWNIILFFIIIGFISLFLGLGVGAGYFASLVKDEPIRSHESMEKAIYNYEETTKLYFANKKYMGDVRSDLHREEITLDKVSNTLIHAVIATEDEYFNEHNGIVPKAIVRAMAQEALNSDTKTGGSTLTQQLIKNQLLTNEVSFDRKAKEILLAMRLENFFEKEEILEAYLNVIPYGRNSSGRNIAGIQTAAQGVFGIDAKDLNIPQAAFLAGMPQNPYKFTPFALGGELKDKEGLKPGIERMKVVLKRMQEENYISEKEYQKAVSYNIVEDFTDKKDSSREKYPYVVKEVQNRATDILMEHLAKEDGVSKKELEKDEELEKKYKILAKRDLKMKGYRIYSTIDKKIYDSFQKVVENYQHFGPDQMKEVKDEETGEFKNIPDPVQAGASLIENKTGKVLAFVGGRGFDIDEYNYSTEVYRQNGSTMKPLAGYAPAMEMGYIQPGTPIADIPPRGGGGPKNYGGTYYGLVSAREALARSYNVSADRLYREIMHTNPVKTYLKKMEFPELKAEEGLLPSTVLGGLETGVTVEQNTSAFGTFSNQGKYVKPHIIEKITTKDGKIIYEHKPKPVKIFSPQTAYLTYDMLRDVVRSGTAASLPSQLHHSAVDWAGKTGTTNDYKDAWFIGTNPNVSLGSWIGYKSNKSLNYCPGCSLSYSKRNLKFWAELANAATAINPELIAPQERLKRPDGIVSRSICSVSGLLPSELCSKVGLTRTDIFNAKYVPTKVDDSLVGSGGSGLVVVDGKTVPAGPKTPKEFVKAGGGFAFNPDFIKRKGYDYLGDLSQLIPRRGNPEVWGKIGGAKGQTSSAIKDTGKSPASPTSVNGAGNKLSWGKPSSKNIVGYRVYRADNPNGSFSLIGSTTNTSYSIGGKAAAYQVKAVDYFGRESSPSKSVLIGKPTETKQKKEPSNDTEEKKNEEKDKRQEKDTEKKPESNKETNDQNKNEPQKDKAVEDDKENSPNKPDSNDQDSSDQDEKEVED